MPGPVSSPPPGGGSAAARILEVAEILFAERGYEGASISEIAQAAGVSKANVFHHFGSKDALYMEVLKAACRHSAAVLEEAVGQAAGDPRAALTAFFVRQLRMLFEQARSTRLLQRELFEHGSLHGRRLAEEVFAGHFGRLVDLVREGQRMRQLRQGVDPALLAFLLIAANVFFFETHAVLEHLPEVDFAADAETYARAVLELLAKGFEPGPEGAD